MPFVSYKICNIIFEHGKDPPPRLNNVKKTALFLRDGFPINHKCKKDPFLLADHDIHPDGEFAKQEAGVGRGGHRSSSQPLLRGRDLLAVHPQASTTSNSTCTGCCSKGSSVVLVLVQYSTSG